MVGVILACCFGASFVTLVVVSAASVSGRCSDMERMAELSKQLGGLKADNYRLSELMREMYHCSCHMGCECMYRSEHEELFAERMRELGIEVD